MTKRVRSKLLEAAKKLPPSYHKLPGKDFDITKSEAVRWLIDQPDILNWVWNNIKNSGDVIYDPATGLWHGVDYEN